MTSVATPRGNVFVGVQVVNTRYTVPPQGAPYYEVHVATSADADIATLRTRDRRLYRAAEDAYLTAERIDCEWALRPLDGTPARALLAIWRSM
jgi:hypothetical protein